MSTTQRPFEQRRRVRRDRLVRKAGLPAVPSLRAATIEVAGRSRTFHVAPAPDRIPAPLIVALHGAGGDGRGMAALTGLATRGPAAGFTAVFPDGVMRVWNDGRTSRRVARRADVDDTAFLLALFDELATRGLADPARTFVCGISNGAFMADHLARVTPLAGLGLVSGTATVIGHGATAPPTTSTPVAIFAGTADPLVPYQGGPIGPLGRAATRRASAQGTPDGDRGRGLAIGAEALAAEWATINGCSVAPAWTRVPTYDLPVWQALWSPTAVGGAPVELFRIDGGGHAWPGGLPYLPERFIGRTAHLDATGHLLDWWRQLSA
jgi:polyhydroxybutyrate depolymerase